MPSTPSSQVALAGDPDFQKRLSSLLVSEALVVTAEGNAIPNHAQRRQFAQQVLTNPQYATSQVALTICNATNMVAADTTYEFETFSVKTSATDAEIRSQIATLWDTLSGV